MTIVYPADYFAHPQAQSGECLHTQESGATGFASHTTHWCNDTYTESTLPVASKVSRVRPIPKEELEKGELPKMPEKMSFPPVESQPTSARDGLFTPTSLSVVQNNRPPTETLLNDNHKEGEVIKASPGSTAITEASVGDSCIMDPKMETDPAKVDPEERRNTMRYGRGGNDKSWKLFLLFMAAVCIPFYAGSAHLTADRCFTCLDKERCPHLKAVYGPDDNLYHQRGVDKSLPICSGMPLLSPKTCNVCLFLSNILIVCSGDVDKPEVEDDNGSQIHNITEGCKRHSDAHSGASPHNDHGHEHIGLICAVLLLYLVCACLI